MNNLSKQVGVYRRPNTNSRYPPVHIGDVFGRWTVLENDFFKRYGRQTHRLCRVRCQCGTERVVFSVTLRNGDSKSCGCKSKERNIEKLWRYLLVALKNRGWDCHLTIPQLKMISQLPCVYCGKEPSNIFQMRYKVDGEYRIDPSLEIRYSGIDRVDSTKGYVIGNVVPCCQFCNRWKTDYPLDYFLVQMQRIRTHNPTVAGIHKLAATVFDGS